jgi:hypothetical protein
MSVQEYIYSGKTVEAKEIKVQSRHTCSHIESSQKDILTNRTYRHVDQKVHPSDVTAGIAVAREVKKLTVEEESVPNFLFRKCFLNLSPPHKIYPLDGNVSIFDDDIPLCRVKEKPAVNLSSDSALCAVDTTRSCEIVLDEEESNPLLADLKYLYIPNVSVCSTLVDISLELESSADLDSFVASLLLPKQSVIRKLKLNAVNESIVISTDSIKQLLTTLKLPSLIDSIQLTRLDIQYVNLKAVVPELCRVVSALPHLKEIELCGNRLNDKLCQVCQSCFLLVHNLLIKNGMDRMW